jgi:magnesium transporter
MLHVDKAYLKLVRDRLEAGLDSELEAMVVDLHPTDVAEVLSALRTDEAQYLFRLLENDLKAEALLELEEDLRTALLTGMTAAEIAEEVLEELDSDDAADVMADLPESKAEEVINLLDDAEYASDIRDLLGYEEGTAGAIMAKELVRVHADSTVAQAIRAIRRQA